ncbi:La-related protein 7, partial [Geodia barretti]
MDVEGEEKDRGKKRVRTKGIQKKLLEQVEFYFGDANLQRDKFLAKKIKEHPDGYVPVETIASFNRMKSLTSDISIVVQVMKTSTLLEVTDDEKWVRRSRPLTTATDTDERTIYVEHLPQSSDQDSVRKLLKVFGNITYIRYVALTLCTSYIHKHSLLNVMCHSVIVSLALDKHVYRVTILDLHH